MKALVAERQSRFRYRLRTLLALTAVVAVAGAVFGDHLRAIQREESAFRQIVAKGGEIHRVWSSGTAVVLFEPSGHRSCGRTQVIASHVAASDFKDKDLRLLDDIRVLQAVNFNGSGVSAEGIQSFARRHPVCRISPLHGS